MVEIRNHSRLFYPAGSEFAVLVPTGLALAACAWAIVLQVAVRAG